MLNEIFNYGLSMYFYNIIKQNLFPIVLIILIWLAAAILWAELSWVMAVLLIVLSVTTFVFYRAYKDATQKLLSPPTKIHFQSPFNIANFIDTQIFPILVLNEDDNVTHLNHSLADSFGDPNNFVHKNSHIGKHVSHLLRTPHLLEAYEQVKASGQATQFNFEQVNRGDRLHWVHIAPLKLTDGSVLYTFTFRDLTQEQKTQRMRVDFIANASHELRTPLASISGFIETLLNSAKNDPAAREKFLPIMQAEADRMTRLIGDLLSLSKIEMNQHSKPTNKVDLFQIAEQVIASAAPLAIEKNTILEFEKLIDEAWIIADADQLLQLVNNLLDNAFKYGLKDQADNKIIMRIAKENDKTCLSIIDFGNGIAKDDLPRLTERFYRVSNSHNQRGTGLGLAIVKHIAQRHSAEIEFESQIGQGTIVKIIFNRVPH